MPTSPTIAETLKEASERLRVSSVPNDLLDAQTLLAHALGKDRTYLIVNYHEPLAPEIRQDYEALVERRAAGEPLQYIIGRQEFFGLDFEVTPAVLIPRPESELIVEEVIRLAQSERWESPVVVDVGTGSGCLAVAIAREIPHARVIATDLSPHALAVARRNAIRNQVGERLNLVAADLLEAMDEKPFAHVILSNPPYVAAAEIPELQREVRDWEPLMALTDRDDGLNFYRRLVRETPPRLLPGGYFICEMGYGQSEAVSEMMPLDIWRDIRLLDDLQGIPRTLVAQLR